MDSDGAGPLNIKPACYRRRRFVALVYNALLVSLLLIAFGLATVVLYGVLTLVATGPAGWLASLAFILDPVAVLLFMSYMTSKGRRTYGHESMGLKVVNRDGSDLVFPKSVLRSLLWIVCALPFGLGFVWTLFDRWGRGLHDAIADTRVISIEEKQIPLLGFIPFALAIVPVVFIIVLVAAMVGLTSFSGFVRSSMAILLYMIPASFILAVIAKTVNKRKKQEKTVSRLANQSETVSVVAGFIFIIAAIALPSNQRTFMQVREKKCEEDLKTIAAAADRYVLVHKSPAQDLSELVKASGRLEIPTFWNRTEYVYRIEKRNGKNVYVIECPDPNRLLKSRGLLPPVKCRAIQYVQGEGLIVSTE